MTTTERASGKVKWFNETKGYGFIIPSDNSKDVFVHVSAVNRSGLKATDLQEETPVTYELETRNSKTSAVNLELAD